MEQALVFYNKREIEITPEIMRQVEGQIMLRILDQRWRDHLYSMDYLKEGIHLRAMGQKNPLTEWQREGFEMFETMMESVGEDFVKYITHIQISSDEATERDPSDSEEASNIKYSGTDEIASGAIAAVTQTNSSDSLIKDAPKPVEESSSGKQKTVVRSDFEKTGRNEPCPCDSGKKFKQCHGR